MATLSLQAAYDQARSFLEVNKVEQAISVAQHILEYFPENLEAHRILGEAYLAGRQFDQAEAAFGRVLHSDPENIPAHVGLGITYERQSKLDRAVGEFEQALEVRPDMPELRSQLLRLYTEVWGAEGATLRLSRPGLARLYAKGHMLPQAIQEFRSVIDESPERFDARVGLAESLWRDGQTDVAAEVCEEILAERPDVLKANLLLGYIRQAAGDASGEPYWRFAQQLEPYQQVARALFEVMPDLPAPELEIPPWDEQAWQAQRAREEQERQTREHVAVPAVASPPAISDDADFFSGWGDESDDQPAAHVRADNNDDFLASLLALSSPIDDGSGVELDSSSGITPFSFDDLAGAAKPAVPADDPKMAPLPLADLGLSEEDEIAAPDTTVDAEPELAPFSLADLGLSEDEIAQFDTPDALVAPAVPVVEDEPELTPFSLADLGLSEDEIAQFDTPDTPAPAEVSTDPQILPFSLADLGLSPDEIAQLNAAAEPAEPQAQPEPFSFDDPFDLSLDMQADLDATPAAPAAPERAGDIAGLSPFDWSASDDTASTEGVDFSGDNSDLQPFSLDDLDLSSVDDYGMVGAGALPPSLQPFSMDDSQAPVSPREMPMPALDPDDSADTGGYSWQQPVAKPRTDFLRAESSAEPSSGSIFSKLKQRASELPKEELPPLPPVSVDDDDVASYFSNDADDVPLHDDHGGVPERFTSGFRLPKEGVPEAAPAAPASIPKMDAEPELTPFSLEDLGLSPEEIALLNDGAPETPAATPALDAEPELTPFSLEDLGLSPEEIALLNGDAPETPVATKDIPRADAATGDTIVPGWSQGEEPELTPFSLEDLGLSSDEIASLNQISSSPPTAQPDESIDSDMFDFDLEDTSSEPVTSATDMLGDEIEPFSLDDFDFDTGDSTVAAEAPTIDESVVDVEPFSFDDMGLSDADMALPGDRGNRELSLTDDELAGLDLGEFEALIGGSSGGSLSAAEPQAEVVTGDPALDRLIMLGQRQGFVDLTDIISVVDDPEAEAERIEEIGWTLHRAGIEIRDGDEIIDMEENEAEADEEYDEPAEFTSPAEVVSPASSITSDAEPDLTPFSLEELGLSPEEIAALGLSEEVPQAVSAPTPPPAPPALAVDAEPELTPFSLEDLGLSPEEIAMLNGAAEPIAPEPARPAAPVDEPELTPFSLEDLGLSPEEIAMLNGAAEPTEPPAPALPTPAMDAEPELTPFSLEDLGLSPEEIAALSIVEDAPTPNATSDDLFSFDMAEERPVEKAVRTAPRIEEPPPPPPTQDTGFLPEPLDSLDNIWDMPVPAAPAPAASTPVAPASREKPVAPAREKSESPARVVLPPLGEREKTSRVERREAPARPRDDDRYARREAPARPRDDDRYARREAPARPRDDLYARREAATRSRDDRYGRRDADRSAQSARTATRQSFGSFVPTGDDNLDEYLIQLEAEPDNYGMALGLARLCAQTGRADLMAYTYKHLIRGSHALDEITDEVQELIDAIDDQAIVRQLYRVLGDALSKQGRLRDAMAAYNHTFGG